MNAIVSSTTSATSTGQLSPARGAELAQTPPAVAALSGTPLIEMRHLLDPCDTAFAVLAVEHPECCSTLADYPEFAAQFASRSAKAELLASLSGGDLPADAVRESRCLMAPIGCGRPLIEDGVARVFWSEAEAQRYEAEWRITGLCPNCQDRITADEEDDRG